MFCVKRILGYFLLALLVNGLAIFHVCPPSLANDVDVGAFLTVRKALGVTKGSDMDFGLLEYGSDPSGIIQLGTDGSTSLVSGASDITLIGGATSSGTLNISGDENSVIDIACESGATLSNTTGDNLILSAIEVAFTSGSFGSGTSCSGLEIPVLSNNLASDSEPTLYMGGSIDVTGITSGIYATANSGGDPATVRITYQ